MGKYRRCEIGKSYATSQGYTVDVVDGGDKDGYCYVEFRSNHLCRKEVAVCLLRNNGPNYPYHRTLYNIGYLGEGAPSSRLNGRKTSAYKVWSGIIQRCYSGGKNSRCYEDCSVDEVWHSFSNFNKWFVENHRVGYDIDKDLLVLNNRIYGPELCVFLPRCINSFISNRGYKSNTSGVTGVYWDKQHGKWKAQTSEFRTGGRVFLGRYSDIDCAMSAYNAGREEQVSKAQIYMRECGFNESIISKLKGR